MSNANETNLEIISRAIVVEMDRLGYGHHDTNAKSIALTVLATQVAQPSAEAMPNAVSLVRQFRNSLKYEPFLAHQDYVELKVLVEQADFFLAATPPTVDQDGVTP